MSIIRCKLYTKIRLGFFVLLSAIFLTFPTGASDTAISVYQAEIRATAGEMTATGGYARIVNSGHAALTLVRVDADFAARAEIHQIFAEDGVMKMRPLIGGLIIPAHGEALLRPGGNHLMFTGLAAELKPGTTRYFTLHFDDGKTVSVMAKVKRPADIGDSVHNHSGTQHNHSDD